MNTIDTDYFRNLLDEEIHTVNLLTQGQIGPIYTLEGTARKYLLKTSEPSENLKTEARMLEDIHKYEIPVPQVLDVSDTHLLMEYIEESDMDIRSREEAAAQALAKLHSVTNESRMYGYWYDTTIGPFPQKNEQTQYNWGLFLGQMRIMPMARICYDRGVLSKGLLERLERLSRDIYKYIDLSGITPSLIHGDLWSGNILFNINRAVLIDPALYFADREMELAFILMFDTFGETFFRSYTKEHPLSEAFDTVKVPLYQIYPLLVHAALYGSAYVGGVKQRLEVLGV
jgi:fructosamine-3-kinase